MGDNWEQKNLINELTQGRELTTQLQSHLSAPSSSKESREILVQKILSSYESALSILRWSSSDQPLPLRGAIRTSESPPSDLVGSPPSEDSDREHRDIASRKRKALPTWTQQVRISPGKGLDHQGRLDDGFSWRKYGQKEILNAKYPRGYYRCTHRSVQGCLATKQVQRSGEDPTMFVITYRGRHTCGQAFNIKLLPSPPSPENQEANVINSMHDLQPDHDRQPQQNQQLHGSREILLNFQTSLKIETENLDMTHDGRSFPASLFDFQPSTSNIEAETQKYFPADSVQIDDNFVGSAYSPSFMSPATSATNYFSVMSPSGMSMNGFGLGRHQHFEGCDQSLELTHGQISSVGLDFPFGTPEFDANFPFDNPGFFS